MSIAVLPVDDDTDAILAMIYAGWESQAICAAVTLKLPDHLAAGATSARALATAAQCNLDGVSRLLRALTSLNVVHVDEHGTYALTASGKRLRTGTPDSLAGQAQWFGRFCWPLWGELAESVKTGVSARVRAGGSGGYGHLLADPEAARVFNLAMRDITRIVAGSLVAAYDFAGVRHIVDVGGGHGDLLAAVLRALPEATGQLIELAHALPGARQRMVEAGLENRVVVQEGDFFTSITAHADAYLLKAVLHNWDDAHCGRILATIGRAMSSRSRLLIIERLLPDQMQPVPQHQAVARSDLNMLVGLGGRERTVAELTSLLQVAGFDSVRVLPLSGAFSLIDARRSFD